MITQEKIDRINEVLQRRVMEQAEWKILPESVELMCSGKIKIENGRTFFRRKRRAGISPSGVY